MNKNSSRLRLFLENILFYGGLTVLTKAFPLIMLPIVTRLLPNASDYGVADMFNVVSNFGTQIAILGMYDAMFREFFDDKDNKEYQKKVTSTAMVVVILGSMLITLSLIFSRNWLSGLLFKSKEYSWVVVISGILVSIDAVRNIVQAPTRMRNQRKVFFWVGIGTPILNYALLIYIIKLGYTFEAIIYSVLISTFVFLIIFIFINKNDFSIKYFDKKVCKELLKIGLPIVPSFLVYWIFTSTDRIIISRLLGLNELGVYSIGVRVASVSHLIYTAFSGGWQYFAFSTMKDEDQVELTSKIFLYLGIISYIAYVFSLPFIAPIFNFLFKGDYVRGSVVFPFLFISPLLLMLFQTISNQFLVIKKSYYSSFILIVGAFINLIVSYFLTMELGIIGASIGTLLGYFFSVVGSFVVLKRLNQVIILNNNFYVLLFGFILTSISIYIFNNKVSFLISLGFAIYLLAYLIKEVKRIEK